MEGIEAVARRATSQAAQAKVDARSLVLGAKRAHQSCLLLLSREKDPLRKVAAVEMQAVSAEAMVSIKGMMMLCCVVSTSTATARRPIEEEFEIS